MTWSLSAYGHTEPRPGDQDWSAVERDLADAVADVLSDPAFGCTSSTFGGNYVSGSLHDRNPVSPIESRHLATTAMLRYFEHGHLPPDLAAVSARAARLARSMVRTLPDSPELTTGLRKLLEAKDCFVRAALDARPAVETDTEAAGQSDT